MAKLLRLETFRRKDGSTKLFGVYEHNGVEIPQRLYVGTYTNTERFRKQNFKGVRNVLIDYRTPKEKKIDRLRDQGIL
jgi:hypothetical protein